MKNAVATASDKASYSYIHVIEFMENATLKVIPEKKYAECSWFLWCSYPNSSVLSRYAFIFNRTGSVSSLLDEGSLTISREDVDSNKPNTTGSIIVSFEKRWMCGIIMGSTPFKIEYS